MSRKNPMTRGLAVTLAAVTLLVFSIVGCGGAQKPRSPKEIEEERRSLPKLYMTPSGKRIVAPSDEVVFVDEQTKELAWPVYECTNPDCPGRQPDGQPHLFIWTDPRMYVTEEGTLGTRDFETVEEWRQAVKEAGGERERVCDKCLTIRNRQTESPEEALKYSQYPHRHVLPQTAARIKELDAQRQEWREYIESRIAE